MTSLSLIHLVRQPSPEASNPPLLLLLHGVGSTEATAWSHSGAATSGPNAGPPGSASAILRSSPAMWSEASSTSPRRSRQVADTAERSCRKPSFG